MTKVILTGATGTAGAETLRQLLLHPSISHVTVLSRRELPPHISPSPPSPKLTVLLHDDFGVYSNELLNKLEGYDACIWCIGSLAVWGVAEDVLMKLQYDAPLAAAQAFSGLKSPGDATKFVFVNLSGKLVNQDEAKCDTVNAKVKGRNEIALAKLRETHPTLTTYTLRPAGLAPKVRSPDASYTQLLVTYLAPVLRWWSPSLVTDTDVFAKAAIEVALKGRSGTVEGFEGKGLVGNDGVFKENDIEVLAKRSMLSG